MLRWDTRQQAVSVYLHASGGRSGEKVDTHVQTQRPQRPFKRCHLRSTSMVHKRATCHLWPHWNLFWLEESALGDLEETMPNGQWERGKGVAAEGRNSIHLLPPSLFVSLPPYKPRSRVVSQQAKNKRGAYFSIWRLRRIVHCNERVVRGARRTQAGGRTSDCFSAGWSCCSGNREAAKATDFITGSWSLEESRKPSKTSRTLEAVTIMTASLGMCVSKTNADHHLFLFSAFLLRGQSWPQVFGKTCFVFLNVCSVLKNVPLFVWLEA